VYGLILLAAIAIIAVNVWWFRKFLKLDKIEDTLNKILAILEKNK